MDCDLGSDLLTLGIDIGTTSVKTALICHKTGSIVAQHTLEHFAEYNYVSEKSLSDGREQNTQKLLLAMDCCIQLLPQDKAKLVKDIVVCGQMHGCVLWNSESLGAIVSLTEENLSQTGKFVSSLITWEDGRCSSEFLCSLPRSSSPLASGFGCATIFWLCRNQPEFVDQFDSAGTIMDLVVSYLCHTSQVHISTQNACSWGYYDIANKDWEIEKLKSANFPTHLLPKICEPGYIVGQLLHSWHDIQSNATVRVALGDMQCSILATHAQPKDAVLNIGTSAQLSVIIEDSRRNEITTDISSYPALHLLPYFDNCCVMVAAALTGGNVLAFFVKTLKNWLQELGLEPPSDQSIYEKLAARGNEDRNVPRLTINPVLWGERQDPAMTASVKDILPGCLSLGNIYNSICVGLLLNIQSMMSNELLEKYGVQRLVGTGNALLQNEILQNNVQEIFRLEFVTCFDTDAAAGAALSVDRTKQA